jgi:hypothetical protein
MTTTHETNPQDMTMLQLAEGLLKSDPQNPLAREAARRLTGRMSPMPDPRQGSLFNEAGGSAPVQPQPRFDRKKEEAKGRAAAAKAEANADPEWRKAAESELARLAASGKPFVSSQIMATVEAQGHDTPEPRALGGIIQGASRRKEIVKTGKTRPTGSHSYPQTEWVGA